MFLRSGGHAELAGRDFRAAPVSQILTLAIGLVMAAGAVPTPHAILPGHSLLLPVRTH
jgi:hypothetical protein